MAQQTPVAGAAKSTGLVYDDRMAINFCPQDPKYREIPERIIAIWSRLNQTNLVNRCLQLPVLLFKLVL